MRYSVLQYSVICIVILLLLVTPTLGKEKSIILTKNEILLLDLSKNTPSKKLYVSGDVKISLDTKTDTELIVKDRKLVFWIPHGTYTGTGNLILDYKGKILQFPFEINLEKDLQNFDISQRFYKKSLQDKSLSCESSAASDILASLEKKRITEDDIIEKLPKTNYYNKLPENNIWGNPEIGFVGYIDHTEEFEAKQKFMTGYGVYEPPIAQVYNDFGYHTQIINKSLYNNDFSQEKHLSYLLRQLSVGHMVQLWGDWCTVQEFDDGTQNSKEMSEILTKQGISGKNECYNVTKKRELSWKYYDTDGNLKTHIGLDGEHAFILLGWKGTINSPTHIRVWDTNTGYHIYPTSEWMRKWEKMDYRSIVIQNKKKNS